MKIVRRSFFATVCAALAVTSGLLVQANPVAAGVPMPLDEESRKALKGTHTGFWTPIPGGDVHVYHQHSGNVLVIGHNATSRAKIAEPLIIPPEDQAAFLRNAQKVFRYAKLFGAEMHPPATAYFYSSPCLIFDTKKQTVSLQTTVDGEFKQVEIDKDMVAEEMARMLSRVRERALGLAVQTILGNTLE